ncbi:MAG: 2-phospho-L-lactate guanylyltransferase [Acidimicrobiia bacterium]
MVDHVRDVVAVVPIRDFQGMTRLAPILSSRERSALAKTLAERVVRATAEAGLRTLIVTAADDVWRWAVGRGLSVCDDPGSGLSDAAATGVACGGDKPWMVVHADLPLVTSSAIAGVAEAAISSTVIVPSHDGGTTVICGYGRFHFSYGTGSFHRHLAANPRATVLVSRELSIDIDTPEHLASFPALTRTHYPARHGGEPR